MAADLALIIHYARANRWSMNALVGAVETADALSDMPVVFVTRSADLLPEITRQAAAGAHVAVAISIMTHQAPAARDLATGLRAKAPRGLTLIAGGPHATAAPDATLNLGFDIVARGEAEASFPAALLALKDGADLSSVRGLLFRRDGRLHDTGPADLVDLNRFPSFAIRHRHSGPIEITRGCPFSCGFCQTSRLFGPRLRHRSVESIVSHVNVLKRDGLIDVRVTSPNAFSYGSTDGRTVDLPAIRDLLRGIRQAAGSHARVFFGSFPSEVRPEHVTPDTVGLVREFCDNDNLIIGGQSGSQRILDHCRRGHTVEDVVAAARVSLEAGLRPIVDLIFGLPGENEEDARGTLELGEELIALGAHIHAHRFTPLPQTRFAEEPPGSLSPALLARLGRLASRGVLTGSWRDRDPARA